MKLLIITDKVSDFSAVLSSCSESVTMSQTEAVNADISSFDAYAVLNGAGESYSIDARLRVKLEAVAEQGKKLLCEFVNSFGYIYSASPRKVTAERIVWAADNEDNICQGDIFDDNMNDYMKPWLMPAECEVKAVYYDHVIAHKHISESSAELKKHDPALWLYGKNVMMAAFRLCYFKKARYAPIKSWEALVKYICQWLTGSKPSFMPENVVSFTEYYPLSFEEQLKQTVTKACNWINMYLIDGGRGGIKEGLSHTIAPDGSKSFAASVRTDCTGEAGGALRMAALAYGGETSVADTLEAFVFGPMQVKKGLFKGMLRWSAEAWGVCYQDDAARAMIPTLIKCLLTGDNRNIGNADAALAFLADTTAKDGTRPSRTDIVNIDEKSFNALSAAEHGHTCAHYNAYYSAALILGFLCGLDRRYLDIGRRGLETLMSAYPDTYREQSETEEMCRLVFPLAVLYEATHEKDHLDMLNRVTADLQKLRHPFGGYREWDTGYKAACSRHSSRECSLLTENGDPVSDMLYSSNWLPLGFAWAHRATGDDFYFKLWKDIAVFMIKTQAISSDPYINGGWCRAFDMDSCEIYGVPHDVGWAACCMESGWTVSEITMGLCLPYIKSEKK